VKDFTGDKSQNGDMVVDLGHPITFRYRVVIHPGNAQDANIAELYKKYAAVK
jgi:hypothetical protein